MIALGLAHSAAWAQTTATADKSQQIQEVVITAERRTSSVQKTAATIVVVKGSDVIQEGRTTTAQILETVPNLVVGAPAGPGGGAALNNDNPNGNITIRGVQTEQGNGGLTSSPATTAVYVDDVYQGIGTDFDLDRVEALAGPQGTLYGRSATGGVVAFHTADPVLGKIAGNFSQEIGSNNKIQTTAAISVPITDQIAVRVAGREFQQDGYFNGDAGATSAQEARVKVLYEPDSNTHIKATWSFTEGHQNVGGPEFVLTGPNSWNFNGPSTPVFAEEARSHQYALNADHDFGFGTVNYVGALHDFDHDVNNPEPTNCPCGGTQTNPSTTPLDQFVTQEVRFASDPGSRLSWLVGANFYSNLVKQTTESIQDTTTLQDTTPCNVTLRSCYYAPQGLAAYENALVFGTAEAGRTFDYGLFTEETYNVTDALHLTAGARLDDTQLHRSINEVFNGNLGTQIFSLNSSVPNYAANVLNDTVIGNPTYRNFTYKLRAAYDLTPENTIYALTSSGFLPGDLQIDPTVNPFAPTTAGIVTFSNFSFGQERLTAYEAGSKNRFLDNTLQLNADVYYYDYSGYHILANTALFGPPVFTVLSLPVKIVGGEFQGVWRATDNDRITVNAGVTDTKVNLVDDAIVYDYSTQVPDVPKLQLSAFYDHTFALADGSTVVPRLQIQYQSGAQVVTESQREAVTLNETPYDYQGPVTTVDFYTTYTSGNGLYTVTGYVRNLGNERYKTAAQLTTSDGGTITGTPGAPRTFGGVFTAKF